MTSGSPRTWCLPEAFARPRATSNVEHMLRGISPAQCDGLATFCAAKIASRAAYWVLGV